MIRVMFDFTFFLITKRSTTHKLECFSTFMCSLFSALTTSRFIIPLMVTTNKVFGTVFCTFHRWLLTSSLPSLIKLTFTHNLRPPYGLQGKLVMECLSHP